jgi:hypothetical protein
MLATAFLYNKDEASDRTSEIEDWKSFHKGLGGGVWIIIAKGAKPAVYLIGLI